MVKLYINNEEVELNDGTTLPLTYQIDDILNPSAIKTEYSKTISLPSTKINDNVLNHLYRADRKNKSNFNVTSKIPFEITYNDRRFQTGYVKFGDITTDYNGNKVYELNLFGVLGEFFSILGDKKMIDLKFDLENNPKLEHNINKEFIYDNWFSAINNPNSVNENIHSYLKYVPLMQGTYDNFSNGKYSGNLSTTVTGTTTPFEVDEYGIKAFSSYRQKPAIKFMHIINAIKNNMTGYTFDDSSFNFLENEYFSNTYLTLMNYNEKDEYIKEIISNNFFINVFNITKINPSNNRIEIPVTTSYDNLDILDNPVQYKTKFGSRFYGAYGQSNYYFNRRILLHETDIYDFDRYVYNFNNGNLSIKTSPVLTNNIELISFNLNNGTFRIKIPANTAIGNIQQKRNGIWYDNIILSSDYKQFYINNTSNNDYFVSLYEYNLIDKVLTSYKEDGTPTFDISIDQLYFDTVNDINTNDNYYDIKITYETKIDSTNNLVNFTDAISDDLLQKDIFLEFCRLFGLYISVKNKKVKIQTRNNFYSNSNTLYWDEKLDLSKDKIITPLAFDKNKLIFGLKTNTENTFLKKYNDKVGYNYGDQVVDTGFDFNDDKLRVFDKTIFNPIAIVNQKLYETKSNGTYKETVELPASFSIDSNSRKNVKSKLSLLFLNGQQNISGPVLPLESFSKYIIFDDSALNISNSEYYYNLSTSQGTAMLGLSSVPKFSNKYGDKSLEFSRPEIVWNYDTEQNYPESYTLYNKFWKNFINDRYSVNTKLMKAYFMLTPNDIENLTFGELIFIDGIYWTLNKINDYDITKEGVSTCVELISVQNISNYKNGQIVDLNPILVPTLVNVNLYNVNNTTFSLLSRITYNGNSNIVNRGICYSTTNSLPTIEDTHTNYGPGQDDYITNVTGLSGLTKYYVRSYATNATETGYSPVIIVNTTDIAIANYSTVNSVTINSVYVSSSVNQNGGTNIIEKGFCWSTIPDPTIDNDRKVSSIGAGSFTLGITGLTSNTLYYIRSYCKNSSGTYYGQVLSFKTDSLPIVSINSYSDLTDSTIDITSTIQFNTFSTISQRGICYSSINNLPNINNDMFTISNLTTLTWINYLTNLTNSTLYYARAYAINDAGIGYSDVITFTTLDSVPRVELTNISGIQVNKVTFEGNIIDTGGPSETILDKGFCWATTMYPTISNNYESEGSGLGSFSSFDNITNLQEDTLYYARAYARNSVGYGYSPNIQSFRTLNSSTTPLFTTNLVTNITDVSATSGGNITDDRGLSITERGIVYSTVPGPTIDNATNITSGSGIGSYSIDITGLSHSVTYYVRAYVININGAYYDGEYSFRTLDIRPIVVTNSISNINIHSVDISSTIVDDSNLSIISKGIVYSTTNNMPNINDFVKYNTNPGYQFDTTSTGLTANTLYYVRSFARNSVGYGYSNVNTFTTLPTVPPTLNLSQIVEINSGYFTFIGNVSNPGDSPVIDRGIVYSTSNSLPTTGDTKISYGSGQDDFQMTISNLSPNTTYYCRLYGINSDSIGYSEMFTVLTNQPPTVTTNNYSNISQTKITVSGTIVNNNGASINSRGIYWGLTNNPTSTPTAYSVVNNGNTFTYNISGLTDNTTYYYRAYAETVYGIGYGEVKSFTTYIITNPQIDLTVSNLTETTATFSGNVITDGGSDLIRRGILWNIASSSTGQTDTPSIESYQNIYQQYYPVSSNLSTTQSIPGNRDIEVISFVQTNYGYGYSNPYIFRIDPVMATVDFINITNITAYSLTGNAELISNGNSVVTEKGICWSTVGNPSVSGNHIAYSNTNIGTYSINIPNLNQNTLYYVRSYAISEFGVAYSDVYSATTIKLPSILTNNATNISYRTVSVSGTIVNTNGITINSNGFYLSTNSNPTTLNFGNTISTNGNIVSCSVSGLEPATKYYYVFYAKTDYGDVYGEIKSFTTYTITTPLVGLSVNNITENSAELNSTIYDRGGTNIIRAGFIWNKADYTGGYPAETPTIENYQNIYQESYPSSDNFQTLAQGLLVNYEYSVVAFAQSEYGYGYSTPFTFTIEPPDQEQ